MKQWFLLGVAVVLSMFASQSCSDDNRGEAVKPGVTDKPDAPDKKAPLTCFDQAPAGSVSAAPPRAFTGGTCPTLRPGMNDIQSTTTRQFMLAVPSILKDGERLPVVFLWHWLGGSANDFYTRAEVQKAVDAQRFLAVIPEAKAGSTFKWPYSAVDSQGALEEELVFFDDMLSCVAAAYSIVNNCVSSVGVSAGALWTAQLASYRGDYLSSFISLSGGTGGVIKPWSPPPHKMPGLVLWGGPTDNCFGLLMFQQTSQTLETELVNGGHFFLECIHNCGHVQPPLPAGSASAFQALWQFVFDHPYWLAPGESPYKTMGVPAGLPEWCGIGQGSAIPRTGECLDPPAC